MTSGRSSGTGSLQTQVSGARPGDRSGLDSHLSCRHGPGTGTGTVGFMPLARNNKSEPQFPHLQLGPLGHAG
jgi:hypothetical protein